VPDLVFTRSYSFLTAFNHHEASASPFLNLAKISEIGPGTLEDSPIIRSPGGVDDVVDDSVFLRLLRIHNEVAFDVFFHFFELLTGVLRH
jgi:hypothetical protein